MTEKILKNAAYKKFEDLRRYLQKEVLLHGGKGKIIKDVKSITNEKDDEKRNKDEKNFVKLFLFPVLDQYFRPNDINVIAEGINGVIRFRNKFFGSNPSADFLFKKENQPKLFDLPADKIPFPIETVGEVKFEKLRFRLFASGLGQIIGYLRASKLELEPKNYGYYIFLNADLNKKSFSGNELKFFHELWVKENIFVVIL